MLILTHAVVYIMVPPLEVVKILRGVPVRIWPLIHQPKREHDFDQRPCLLAGRRLRPNNHGT